MQRLTVGSPMRDLLLHPGEVVELCDEAGQTFGYFVSVAESRGSVYDWATAQISDRELDRRRREVGGKTTAEVLEQLTER